MATKPPKKSRKERRAEKAIAKESNTTLGLNCLGPNCGKPTNTKKQKTSKKKRQGREQRLFVASESESTQHSTTSSERVPAMDVIARVYDVDGSMKSAQLTGDVKTDVKTGKDIGFTPKGVIKAESGNVAPGGIEETTNGGLKRDYYSKGLYKKSKSGDVHKIKGYSTYSEGGHQKELIKTTRGGDVASFKSTEGMTKGEKRMHKKSARENTPGTRYISENRLENKTDRASKRLNKRADRQLRHGKTGKISSARTREKYLGQTHI